jgi:vacuolar protein sorting-associated protein 13A/C
MVLETIAANLLSKYLGDYLGGLQKENLKLSVLSGNVSLENVELKREAVDSLDLPLIVKTGTMKTKWVSMRVIYN